MKIIVVYKSKTGYTEQYAKWIAEDLDCDLKEANEISMKELDNYDVIIYGGGLYAVGINGISIIKKNYELLKDKNVVVWATGSSPGREEELNQVWKFNFSEEQLASIKTFYLRGGFDYKKLNTGNKVLMNMLKVRLKLKKQRTEDEQGMLEAYSIPEYHCQRSNISGLVQYIKVL